MGIIKFTSNYDDLSTDKGYQFKFYCDRCHNGYMTHFQTSITGMAGSLLRAAGDLFGGVFHSAGNSAYEIQRAVGGKAHDEAFQAAIEECKRHFKQCVRCAKWICPEVCFNQRAGLCMDCAPSFEQERAAAQAQAARDQLHRKAAETDYVADVDMRGQAQASCSRCGAASTGGKFCSECGSPMGAAQNRFCTGCGQQIEGQPKFCPSCGAKQPLWQ